jgi:hypothetical protein
MVNKGLTGGHRGAADEVRDRRWAMDETIAAMKANAE